MLVELFVESVSLTVFVYRVGELRIFQSWGWQLLDGPCCQRKVDDSAVDKPIRSS